MKISKGVINPVMQPGVNIISLTSNIYFYFPRFDMDMPIYVNLVRDPVERVISWYYYVRAPWYFVERKRAFPDLPLPNPNWLRKVQIPVNLPNMVDNLSFFRNTL